MTSRQLYARLLRYVLPYWRVFALALLGMVITALTEPAMPALLQPLLDGGFVGKDPLLIILIPIILMLIVLLRGIAMLATTIGMTWVASRLVMDLRTDMFAKLMQLPTVAFDDASSGVLLSKFSYDVNRVMAAATDALVILVRDSLAILGLLAWMFYLNWQLSLIIFTIVPVIVLVVRWVSKRLRRLNTAMQDSMGDMTRIIEEAISGHKLVKIFAGQQYEQQRFRQASDGVRRYEVKTQITSGISVFIVQLLTATALAVIVYIAALMSVQNEITVGGFVSLFTAMGLLFAPVKRLTKVNEQIQQGLAAAQSVFALIDKVPEMDKGTHPTRQLSGTITFNRLTFQYAPEAKPAVHSVNLTIEAGETVALVGASGSGKTTLANLIPRFYPLPEGCLLLDGIDINALSLHNLRANIALVSQEVVLFNDTIAANIAYGSMGDALEADIIAAAKAAYAWEFIAQLPQGLNTVVGERGVKLSGGQRQRLAIARALLKDAPILIFDEATSALDTQSELAVQRSLEQLKTGRTTLIIAHRLSTIAHADRIVVMAQGHIVEVGTHQSLLAQQGVYAQLYQNAKQE